MRLLNKIKQSIHGLFYAIGQLVKATYKKLPFDIKARNRHKDLLSKYAPWFMVAPLDDKLLKKLPPYVHAIINEDIKADDIHMNSSIEPVVSIIIPTYGKINYTLKCLRSIALHRPSMAFEIIVIDDGYPGATDILKQIKGIRLITNNENKGYLHSCNMAAEEAKGQYLHLLNNDTIVIAGWLDELIKTFGDFPQAGLVGSKLIFDNGRLQEAGSIVWRDASTSHYGRSDDPSKSIYNYLREADYCSAASIVIPKNLFEQVGKFSTEYAPAYYEDTDLAFKVREAGYKVYYQPASSIVHFEGISHQRSVSLALHTKANQQKFLKRWATVLNKEHYAHGKYTIKKDE